MDSVIQSTNENQTSGRVLHADDSGFCLVAVEEKDEEDKVEE